MSRPMLDSLLAQFTELKGSDLYLTVGCPASVRSTNRIIPLSDTPLTDDDIEQILSEMLNEDKREEFYSLMEYNAPMEWNESVRFRINVFRQQQHTGIVIRHIYTEIPTLESLKLPKIYGELIMENRGLVVVVGPTGSGKSTSLAAMIGHRNTHGYGHIVTVEDPIEFVHKHKNCIITQRDVGIDTYSFGMALKNVLRQRPDVVLIGEIRDHETMEHALHFSETGHLCVATLHAGNSQQAIERMIHFFPEDKHHQIHATIARNLRGILSQRLVLTSEGTRSIAVEVMLVRGIIRTLIQEDKTKEIPEIIAKNRNEGMQTIDQALYQLYIDNVISEDIAISESDNPANLRILIRQYQNSSRVVIPALKLKSTSSDF